MEAREAGRLAAFDAAAAIGGRCSDVPSDERQQGVAIAAAEVRTERRQRGK